MGKGIFFICFFASLIRLSALEEEEGGPLSEIEINGSYSLSYIHDEQDREHLWFSLLSNDKKPLFVNILQSLDASLYLSDFKVEEFLVKADQGEINVELIDAMPPHRGGRPFWVNFRNDDLSRRVSIGVNKIRLTGLVSSNEVKILRIKIDAYRINELGVDYVYSLYSNPIVVQCENGIKKVYSLHDQRAKIPSEFKKWAKIKSEGELEQYVKPKK